MKTILYICPLNELIYSEPGTCLECGAPLEPAEFVWSKDVDALMREKDAEIEGANRVAFVLSAYLTAARDIIAAKDAIIADYAESAARITSEQCAPDEQHCSCVPELRKEIERLRDALAFYANPDEWKNDTVDIGVGDMDIPSSAHVYYDGGELARAASKAGRNEPPPAW